MPSTIHDFAGFPSELFNVQYPAKGEPSLAAYTKELIKSTTIELDDKWGLDHGAWSVIKHLYPAANIPVIQLSIDYTKPPIYHYELAIPSPDHYLPLMYTLGLQKKGESVSLFNDKLLAGSLSMTSLKIGA